MWLRVKNVFATHLFSKYDESAPVEDEHMYHIEHNR